MAVRYSKRDQTKLVNRVKKLIAQGKTLNAACTSVSEREGGRPSANSLANWVKATELADTAPAPEEAAPAAPKKRRRRTATRKPAPAAVTEVPEPEQDTTNGTPVEQPEVAAAGNTEAPPAEATAEAEAPGGPLTESATASVAELVHIRTADRTAETTGDLDDLLDENLRLRTALSEANREIRAMRDLLVVYASR